MSLPCVNSLKLCIETRGYDVTACADAETAVNAEFRHQIRALPRGDCSIILVLAGSGQAEQLLTALEARADEYVLKPVNPDLLKARLILVERPYQRHIQQRYVEEEELCMQNEESLVSYDKSVISPLP